MEEAFPLKMESRGEILTAKELCQTLQEAGHQAFFAGGSVRDLLLNRPVHDVDIATSAKPDAVLSLFQYAHYHGKAFGVVEVLKDKGHFQIATFRKESNYTDFRHPETVEFTDAESDAQRRDFTVNALFLDPVREVVIDYVDGRKDIEEKTLRAVGNPHDRFQEDALRLLRAVRFLNTLPLTPADHLLDAITQHAERIQFISRERIFQELNRLFTETRHLNQAVQCLISTTLLKAIDDTFFYSAISSSRLMKRFSQAPSSSALLPWCLLALPEGEADPIEPALNFLKRLTCPNRLLNGAVFIHQTRQIMASRTALHDLDWMRIRDHTHFDVLSDFLQAENGSLSRACIDRWRKRMAALPPTPVPLLSGKDLIAAGVPPSPRMSEGLETLYQAQIEGKFQTKEEGLNWFNRNFR